ncbi:hypothetical protein [Allosalinactinospora lopnorensis]|uniref:hypothetical protein n=1 Tax=Allosalinactinospora lopnorensis TaxID=1352348 RepID=UPI000623BD33|nr:hypothetical protein [Allosalinactinospora lopnorensis]
MRRARAEATRHLTSVLSPWLDHADGGSAPGGERTAAAAAALAVGVAEAGARMLLDTGRHWTPAELARLAARLFAGGVPALAEDPQD